MTGHVDIVGKGLHSDFNVWFKIIHKMPRVRCVIIWEKYVTSIQGQNLNACLYGSAKCCVCLELSESLWLLVFLVFFKFVLPAFLSFHFNLVSLYLQTSVSVHILFGQVSSIWYWEGGLKINEICVVMMLFCLFFKYIFLP